MVRARLGVHRWVCACCVGVSLGVWVKRSKKPLELEEFEGCLFCKKGVCYVGFLCNVCM